MDEQFTHNELLTVLTAKEDTPLIQYLTIEAKSQIVGSLNAFK